MPQPEKSVTPDFGEITEILQDWNKGDREAINRVLPLVYEKLRQAARYKLGSAGGHTLEPTALINEVYLRMLDVKSFELKDRTQFYHFAGMLMRRILVDHARARLSQKRGGTHAKVPLEYLGDIAARENLDPVTLLALDTALNKLKQLEPRQSRMVELRFFAGLTIDELAEIFQVSTITVKRDFRSAKLWLARELKQQESEKQ